MIDALMEWVWTQIQHNEIFAGVVAGSGLVTAGYYLRAVPWRVWDFTVRQSTVRLTVHSDQPVFDGLVTWLSRTEYAQRTRRLQLSAHHDEEGWLLSPGVGHHLLSFRGWPVLLSRTRSDPGTSWWERESLEVQMLGRSQRRMRALLAEARKFQVSRDDTIRMYLWSGWWDSLGFRPKRPLESVVLAEGQAERIIGDARAFLGRREWYRQHGIPWRRGYMLAGEPGTGKSSFVAALAGHLDMPIYILNLSTVRGDNELLRAFAGVPPGAILLVEDIDAATAAQARDGDRPVDERPRPALPRNADEPEGAPAEKGVTLSGLLNVIDGVASPEGRLLFLTSNHPEKLDPALIRPGRVDLQERFGLFGPAEVKRMLVRFYRGGAQPTLPPISLNGGVSPAQVQQVCMGNANPRAAVAALMARGA